MALGLAMAGTLAACSGGQQRALDLAAQADALLQAGNLPEARKTIAEAIRERDDIVAIHIEAGRIEMAAKSPVDAYRAYSEALALEATNVEALQAVSQLGFILGAREEADKAAARLLVVLPGEPNALLIRGLVALQQHKYAEAAQFGDRILEPNPTDVRGLILKARILYSQGEIAKALAVLDPVAGARSLPVMLTLLELHRVQGDAAAMRRDFAVLGELRPDHARQKSDEANLLYKTGDKETARATIRKLLERPDDQLPRIVSLWQQYDPDPFPLRSPADVPKFGNDGARRAVARYFLDAGQPAKALLLLGTADSSEDGGLRARALAMQGKAAEAVALADTILTDDKTQCDALFARAWSNRGGGRARAAIIDAQQAVSECPREPGGYFELARAFQALGDRQGEFRTFDSALEAMPQNALLVNGYYNRAIATGDVARAASVARRATRLTPSFLLGWKLMADACRRLADDVCLDNAEAGLKRASSAYVLDPLPGEAPSRELFSRLDQ